MSVSHNYLEDAGKKPAVSELEKAEIGINLVDKTLWTKDNNGDIVSLNSEAGAPNPNLLFNGDFNIWQRGTNITTTTGKPYVADRWFSGLPTTYVLGSRQVPNSGNITTIKTTLTPLANAGVRQRLENFRRMEAGAYTIQGRVNSTNSVRIIIRSITAVTSAEDVISDVTVPSTWDTPVVHTFNITPAQLLNPQAEYLEVMFISVVTSDIEIGNMKLEKGSIATPFKVPNVAEELTKCQRYYQRISQIASKATTISVLSAYSATDFFGDIKYSTKRASPSVYASNVSKFQVLSNGALANITNITFLESGYDNVTIKVTGTTTPGSAGSIRFSPSVSGAYIEIDAEI